MDVIEAKVAARLNSIVLSKTFGVYGYVYSVAWVHEKGKPPMISVGCHDLHANSVFSAPAEDLTVSDWQAPMYIVNDWIEKEKSRRTPL